MAKKWKTVPARYRCEAGRTTKQYIIPTDEVLVLEIETAACEGGNNIKYLEHVQVFYILFQEYHTYLST